ncbi:MULTISPECIES: histidinol-phosphatase [unclassified Pseudoalteromonas]|uniref:histidinol-phosphatase n=1 Tax=unclassified Pseudoalteromonas TaxID=194690 RepID=UPI0033201023
MIDSHTHTKYSKHATGSVTELVEAAISNGIKILTITDHAPFLIDTNNRLLESELDSYAKDVLLAQQAYKGHIKILYGMEFDYSVGHSNYVEKLMRNLDLDFAIGSIHYIETVNGRVNNWDINKLNTEEYCELYFEGLEDLIHSNLFNSLGHVDSILRGGVSERYFWSSLKKLIPKIKAANLSYEVNCSGMFKSMICHKTGEPIKNRVAFPNFNVIKMLADLGMDFTIGSDAHKPEHVGRGIKNAVKELRNIGVNSLCYYERGKKNEVNIKELCEYDVPIRK